VFQAVKVDTSEVTVWYKIGTIAMKLHNYSLARLGFEQVNHNYSLARLGFEQVNTPISG
jgi:hypothetical protein